MAIRSSRNVKADEPAPSKGIEQPYPSESNLRSQAKEASFEKLMQQLCQGSEEAAWEIFDRFAPHILRVIRASLPNEIRSKVDSVDLLNTLMGSLLIKRSYLSNIREPAQLFALLTKAAKNRVIDEHRKYTVYASRSIRSEEGAFDEQNLAAKGADKGVAGDGRYGGREQSPSQVAIAREKWRQLLDSLSRRDQQIVALRMKGHTYEEIATKIEDVSARTARRVLASTVEKLME